MKDSIAQLHSTVVLGGERTVVLQSPGGYIRSMDPFDLDMLEFAASLNAYGQQYGHRGSSSRVPAGPRSGPQMAPYQPQDGSEGQQQQDPVRLRDL